MNFLKYFVVLTNFSLMSMSGVVFAYAGSASFCERINGASGYEGEFCTETECFFPGKSINSNDVVIDCQVSWDSDKDLILHTRGNIFFEETGRIVVSGDGSLFLKSGMEPGDNPDPNKLGKIVFKSEEVQIFMNGRGKVRVYYHPVKGQEKHKYHNPEYMYYKEHTSFSEEDNLYTYMLVNDIYDLQNIHAFLSGNYALSQDVDASVTRNWSGGKGFEPLKDDSKNMPFSGDFDGNGYKIENLYINRPDEEDVGLFGSCRGFRISHNIVENLLLQGFNVTGDYYVGAFAGQTINTEIFGVSLRNFSVAGRNIVGGFIGTMYGANFNVNIFLEKQEKLESGEYKGYLAGSSNECEGVVNFLIKEEQNFDEKFRYGRFKRPKRANRAKKVEYVNLNEEYPYIGAGKNNNILYLVS